MSARADAATIVLVHGAASARVWDPVLHELSREHRVFTPTLAGHFGGPPLTAQPSEIVDRLVDILCRQLDAAGIGAAHVVGNSLGGWVALELARRDRAQSVLAFSPAGGWTTDEDLTRLLRLFRLGAATARHRTRARVLMKIPALRRIMLRLMAENTDRLTMAQIDNILNDVAECAVLTDLIVDARRRGPMPSLDRNACPIRIAWGTHDRMLPFWRYGVPMTFAVPAADLVLLPKMGHVPMIDNPKHVSRMILDFVASVPFSDNDHGAAT